MYVYVQRWIKTTHAIIFKLSNKNIQANFSDKSEITISRGQKLLIFTNSKGATSEYPLAAALNSTKPEIQKRIKYIIEVVNQAGDAITIADQDLN